MASLFRRATKFDRRKLLSKAAKARKQGKPKRAIEAYQRVLEENPNDAEVHRRVAPLLAKAGRHADAQVSYGHAVKSLMQAGFDGHALGLCREATSFYPGEPDLWETIASLRLRASNAPDAVAALLEGRSHLRRRKQLPQAIRLLERAHEIAPKNEDVAIDLSRLLARSGRRDRARAILARLERTHDRRLLRRVRIAQFRTSPSFGTAWRALRIVLTSR